MRTTGVLAFLALVACKIDNPAWIVTDGDSNAGTGANTDASGTTTAGVTSRPTSGPDATASGTSTSGSDTSTGIDATSSGTLPATSEPGTTVGPDTTTGPGTTTGPDTSSSSSGGPDPVCMFTEPVDDLELTYSSTLGFNCDPLLPRHFYARVLEAGANQWSFAVCDASCVDNQADCDGDEVVVITFAGPALLGPALDPGQCQHISLVARADPNNLQQCPLRALRLADPLYTPSATHYFGAIGVPATQALAGVIDWPGLANFEVSTAIEEPCGPDCAPQPGLYAYELKWGEPQVKDHVTEGSSVPAEFMVASSNQNMVELMGSFHALRARRGASCTPDGQDFKWLWRAELPPP